MDFASFDFSTEIAFFEFYFELFFTVSCEICLLQELPASIGKLKALANLNVDRNRLHGVPNDVMQPFHIPMQLISHLSSS